MAFETIDERLQRLGIVLPTASEPAAKYANFVAVNGLLFISGKGPTGQDGMKPRGKLGQEFNTEQGYQYARQAGIEVLAVVRSAVKTWNQVKRVVKLQGFINATPDFDEHHKVLNGCSDLLIEVFGEQGIHARSVLGAASLRDNLPVIVDSIFEIDM
jgi:enamine deaminase RidA (YjgF/YER057c/UK114 family)